MNKLFYLITVSFLVVGCVSQSDFDEIKSENENLRNKIEELEMTLSNIKYNYELLVKEKKLAEIERNKKIYRNESEALSLLKDYYDFYNADEIYRNPKVRRVDNNTFSISLEECPKKGGFSNDNFFWRARVITLVVNNDGTYNVN